MTTPVLAGRDTMRDAWGKWIDSLAPWDWYATMTFAPISPGEGSRYGWTKPGWHYTDARWRRWIGETTARAGFVNNSDEVKWVRCREMQKTRGVTHFHALIAGTASLSRRAAWQNWWVSNGICEIEPYHPSRGASFYLCKYITKEGGEVMFSDNLGPSQLLTRVL